MSKPKSTPCAVGRSELPMSTSGGAQESHTPIGKHKGGISTGVVVGTLYLSQSATGNRPTAPKGSPKKGAKDNSKKQAKEEKEERQVSLYDRDTDSFTKQHEIDEGLLVFICWHTGRLSDEEFDHYHKSKKRHALRPVLSNIPVEAGSGSGADLSIATQRLAEEIEALSIGEPSELESILDAVIKRELASPKRLPPPGRKIIKKCVFSTWSSLIKDPDPGMERYKEIYAAGWKDPTKEWLLDLKIPCSIVYTKNYKPMDLDSSPEVDPDQSFSSNSDSSFSLLDDDEETFEGEGVSEPGDMETPMRASSMTLGDMTKCGWVFYDELPEVDIRKNPTSTTNKKSQGSLRDITVRPRQPIKPRKSGERDQKLLGLHSKLLIEIHGQIDEVSSSILYLPERWKFIGKMKPRLPELVLPDEYKSAMEDLDMKQSSSKNHGTSKSRATPPVSGIKKPPSVQNDSSSQSSPSEEFVQQSNLGNDLYKLLRKRYPLTGQSARDGCQVKELERVINGWNTMPRYINCTSELWNTLERLPGTSGKVVWLSDEEMIQQDNMHRSGNAAMNERIHNCAILEQGIIRDFLLYSSSRDALSEGEVESGSGAILQKFISGDGIVYKRNSLLRIPHHLRPLGARPFPDMYARVEFNDNPDWHDDLKPIIFAGECKTEKTRGKNTPAQLAVAFHATLIILILYYLDNRSCASDPLPEWLYLYGIIYTEHGFIVHVHFPYYKFDGPNPGWGFTSAKFTDRFSQVFKNRNTDLRLSALAFLFRMRSQGMLVMEKLKAWERAPKVLAVLQKQAYEKTVRGSLPEDTPRGMLPKRKRGPRITI